MQWEARNWYLCKESDEPWKTKKNWLPWQSISESLGAFELGWSSWCGARTRGNAKAGLGFFHAVYSFRRVFTTPYWHFDPNSSLLCKVRRIQIGRIGLFDFLLRFLGTEPKSIWMDRLKSSQRGPMDIAGSKKCPSVVSSVSWEKKENQDNFVNNFLNKGNC